MKNTLLLYFKVFILLSTLIFNLISCHKDDKSDTSTATKQDLVQVLYSISDVKSFNLYSPVSFKYYPWTINTTLYPGITFPDNSIVKVNSDISWYSSNENVIKVVEGVVVALYEGEVNVNAIWTPGGLTTNSKFSVIHIDNTLTDYQNWEFNNIDPSTEMAATFYPDTNGTTIYWIDPYYLTTSYIMAYSSTEVPEDCTSEKEGKTIIELDLTTDDLQSNEIEVDQDLKKKSMYHYTFHDLDRSKINYFIMCKKQTLSITKNQEPVFTTSRQTTGSFFYLPIVSNEEG